MQSATDNGHYNDNQVKLIAVTVTLMTLSTVVFFVRLFSRWQTAAHLWWDDYLVFFALIFSYGPNACILAAVFYGLGKHATEVPPQNIPTVLELAWIEQVTWQLALPFIKFSLLAYYWRFFPVPKMRLAVKVVGAFVLCWLISTTIVQINACTPVAYYWNRIGDGHCLDYNNFYIAIAALNMITDLVVLFMPLPVIWHLAISQNKKLGLSLVFVLGSFVCIASILRMAYLHTLSPLDITYTGVIISYWACAEASGGVITACIPACAPLVLKLMRQARGQNSKISKPTGYLLSANQKRRKFHGGFKPMDEFETVYEDDAPVAHSGATAQHQGWDNTVPLQQIAVKNEFSQESYQR